MAYTLIDNAKDMDFQQIQQYPLQGQCARKVKVKFRYLKRILSKHNEKLSERKEYILCF